jgi:hypothetical protein
METERKYKIVKVDLSTIILKKKKSSRKSLFECEYMIDI